MATANPFLLAPWLLAVALAFKRILEVKATCTPGSWEADMLLTWFLYLVVLSFFAHQWMLRKAVCAANTFCAATPHLAISSCVLQGFISIVKVAAEYKLFLGPAVYRITAMINGLLADPHRTSCGFDRAQKDKILLIFSLLTMAGFCYSFYLRVPREKQQFRASPTLIVAALIPWYVVALEAGLEEGSVAVASILLGVKLG